jgi:membrane protease YdiL (CAAX protease family)
VYSLPGFLGVSAFGFCCAIAVEKTASLLPSIVVHVLTNALILGGQAWLTA